MCLGDRAADGQTQSAPASPIGSLGGPVELLEDAFLRAGRETRTIVGHSQPELPLIGVGFMYPQGYFHQSLTADGWQQEVYEKLNWTGAPVEPAITPDGKPCITAVPLGNRTVLVAVWRVRVGRVVLYLLDTDLEGRTAARVVR